MAERQHGRMCTEKGLACESSGNSTGGRVHSPTAMLWFFHFGVSCRLSSYHRDAETITLERKTTSLSGSPVFDPARCAHLPSRLPRL